MSISRREFLAWSSAAALLPARRSPSGGDAESAPGNSDCLLLDLGASCTLPESRAGYENALADARVPFVRWTGGPLPRAPTIIVPACGVLAHELMQDLAARVRAGSALLLEVGTGFCERQALEAQRQSLQSHFHFAVALPINLWPEDRAGGPIPYIDYTWPRPAKVRDFSRVVPIRASGAETIGRAGDLAVAMKTTLGKGTLVFLGSPLGPHLWAGDREAQRWFEEALAAFRPQ